jgi:hypothetical protein
MIEVAVNVLTGGRDNVLWTTLEVRAGSWHRFNNCLVRWL